MVASIPNITELFLKKRENGLQLIWHDMIEKNSKRKTSHHKFFFDPLAPKVESHHPSYDDQKDDVEVKKAKRCSPNGRTCRNL